jgi:hypothetical protein
MNSSSLTFVLTDFVLRDGFMLHRLGGASGQGPQDAIVSLEGQQGAGAGLRG